MLWGLVQLLNLTEVFEDQKPDFSVSRSSNSTILPSLRWTVGFLFWMSLVRVAEGSSAPTLQPSRQPTLQPTANLPSSLRTNLVAYYPFDGNANDESGNGNNGVVHSATLTTDRFGNANSAYSFDGSSSYIEISNGVSFNSASKDMSLLFWVNPSNSQSGIPDIFDKTHSGGLGWTVELSTGSANCPSFYYYVTQGSAYGPGCIQLVSNGWNHFVVTKQGAMIKGYLNTALYITGNASSSAFPSNGNLPLLLGARNVGNTSPASSVSSYFKGVIDDIFIYNRTLSAAEITQLYQFDSPTSQPSSQPSRRPSRQPTAQPTSQPTRQPSAQPTGRPSQQPSRRPTQQPSNQPSQQPTAKPTTQPSSKPSSQPSGKPSRQPSRRPTSQPSSRPSVQPSARPSNQPTRRPSTQPSSKPSNQPSKSPSGQPTGKPSRQPTRRPSTQPTSKPSNQPSDKPSRQPSKRPSVQPTSRPSGRPSSRPSVQPSRKPSNQPTSKPSAQPSGKPSQQPSTSPSSQPTGKPSRQPTRRPTTQPSSTPSNQPSGKPSQQPTDVPTRQPSSRPSDQPSRQPSIRPSAQPTSQPSTQPTGKPSRQPTGKPTTQPTSRPSSQPSHGPSAQPSGAPSREPSVQPSNLPTRQPSVMPSMQPTRRPSGFPTVRPSTWPTNFPSSRPTRAPSRQPISQPTLNPSQQPNTRPTAQPSSRPSSQPSGRPSGQPSKKPSQQPSRRPSSQPTIRPTGQPSDRSSAQPTGLPTRQPSRMPTKRPSSQPSRHPSKQPYGRPSAQPTKNPTSKPSRQPSGRPSVRSSNWLTLMPTLVPTILPSGQPTLIPTLMPSRFPTINPSHFPTLWPSHLPTDDPSLQPTLSPTIMPSGEPTLVPTLIPSVRPTGLPTYPPSHWPTDFPSPGPSYSPSWVPTLDPSVWPTWMPTWVPTKSPTTLPTIVPSTFVPTTLKPSTVKPSTIIPTTWAPSTVIPTTVNPTVTSTSAPTRLLSTMSEAPTTPISYWTSYNNTATLNSTSSFSDIATWDDKLIRFEDNLLKEYNADGTVDASEEMPCLIEDWALAGDAAVFACDDIGTSTRIINVNLENQTIAWQETVDLVDVNAMIYNSNTNTVFVSGTDANHRWVVLSATPERGKFSGYVQSVSGYTPVIRSGASDLGDSRDAQVFSGYVLRSGVKVLFSASLNATGAAKNAVVHRGTSRFVNKVAIFSEISMDVGGFYPSSTQAAQPFVTFMSGTYLSWNGVTIACQPKGEFTDGIIFSNGTSPYPLAYTIGSIVGTNSASNNSVLLLKVENNVPTTTRLQLSEENHIRDCQFTKLGDGFVSFCLVTSHHIRWELSFYFDDKLTLSAISPSSTNYTILTDLVCSRGLVSFIPEYPTMTSSVFTPPILPTPSPSRAPSVYPTIRPTLVPTVKPTRKPTLFLSVKPTLGNNTAQSNAPTLSPSTEPSESPTVNPTVEPTESPTENPSEIPTESPSVIPSKTPTYFPSEVTLTTIPTVKPTTVSGMTRRPFSVPTRSPTQEEIKNIECAGNREVNCTVSGLIPLACNVNATHIFFNYFSSAANITVVDWLSSVVNGTLTITENDASVDVTCAIDEKPVDSAEEKDSPLSSAALGGMIFAGSVGIVFALLLATSEGRALLLWLNGCASRKTEKTDVNYLVVIKYSAESGQLLIESDDDEVNDGSVVSDLTNDSDQASLDIEEGKQYSEEKAGERLDELNKMEKGSINQDVNVFEMQFNLNAKRQSKYSRLSDSEHSVFALNNQLKDDEKCSDSLGSTADDVQCSVSSNGLY